MNNLNYKSFYKRNLPHYQLRDTYYFITFTLAFSLSQNLINKLKQEKEAYELIYSKLSDTEKNEFKLSYHRKKYDYLEDYFHKADQCVNYLKNSEIADIVIKSLHYFDKVRYDLSAYCIMPNHVHLIIKPYKENEDKPCPLQKIMHSIKSFTANQSNKTLNKTGQFWNHENYDHLIRDENDFYNCLQYVINNPVKAKLVNDWKEWKYTYVSEDFLEK